MVLLGLVEIPKIEIIIDAQVRHSLSPSSLGLVLTYFFIQEYLGAEFFLRFWGWNLACILFQ
jgi:hypothetical protein